MADKKWLSSYFSLDKDWQSGQSTSYDHSEFESFGMSGADVRLYETSVSGFVLISKTGGGGVRARARFRISASNCPQSP
jgi:hypothetical protein